MILFFNSLLISIVFAWLYMKIVTQRPTESETRQLKESGYWLGIVGPFLFEQNQLKRDIYANRSWRRKFFRQAQSQLARDAWRMLRTEKVGFWAVLVHTFYWMTVPLLWLKSWVYCAYLDVFFVSGLSLTLYRSTQKHRV